MRVNILENISFKKIDDAIDEYNYETSEMPKYIIMNEETFQAIKRDISHGHTEYSLATFVSKDYNYAQYYGCPIAICRKLKYGEIEIV